MKAMIRLLGLFKPYRLWLAGGVVLSASVILANVALLALSGWFITAMALVGLGFGTINYFTPAAAIRGLSMIRAAGRYGERLLTHDATLKLLARLRQWFYEHLEPLAPAGLQFHRSGDLLSRIQADIDTLDNFYLRVIVPVLAAAISIVIMQVFLQWYSPRLALLNLLGLLLVGCGLPALALWLGARPGRQIVARSAELRAGVTDFVQGFDELYVYQALGRQQDHVARLSQAMLKPQRRQAWWDALLDALSGLVARLTLWLALLVIIPLVASGRLAGADLAMLAFFILASFEAVLPLPQAFRSLGEVRAAAQRIFDLVDARPAVTEPEQEVARSGSFTLGFWQVCMRYDARAPWALDGLDLEIDAGQSLAVVGPTGAGKTSLFNALLRFWDYQAGQITIDQTPIESFRGSTIRDWCVVVAQKTHLFNASIRDNLLLARPEASDEQLWQALRQAGIDAEIGQLSLGLDTVLGETGTRLSGGQARRIAIARAFLKDAPILLLDEPTEGLDAQTERQVLQALRQLMAHKTTLLITHRPQALHYVDQIAVLENGRIVEQGRPEELLPDSRYLARYATLY